MKKIVVVFEVPGLLLEALHNRQILVSANGVTLYPIRIDTDTKQTLLDLCITESQKQEHTDAHTMKSVLG